MQASNNMEDGITAAKATSLAKDDEWRRKLGLKLCDIGVARRLELDHEIPPEASLKHIPWRIITDRNENSAPATVVPSKDQERQSGDDIKKSVPDSKDEPKNYLSQTSETAAEQKENCHNSTTSHSYFPTVSYLDLREEQNLKWAQGRLYDGVACAKKGQKASAEKCYQEGLEMAPNYGELLVAYGALCANEGRLEEATSFFQKAISADPQTPNASLYLTLIQQKQQQQEAGCKKSSRSENARQDALAERSFFFSEEQQEQQKASISVSNKKENGEQEEHYDPYPLLVEPGKNEENGRDDSSSRGGRQKLKHRKKHQKKRKKRRKYRRRHYRDNSSYTSTEDDRSIKEERPRKSRRRRAPSSDEDSDGEQARRRHKKYKSKKRRHSSGDYSRAEGNSSGDESSRDSASRHRNRKHKR